MRRPCFALVLLGVSQTSGLSPSSSTAKATLLDAISAFKAATAVDGNVPIDFGVKGGELDGNTRAPRNLFPDGFKAVSERVHSAAEDVMTSVAAIEQIPSLAADATESWRSKETTSPLDGEWLNLWTTAADATFDEKTERGAARVSNVIDSRRGKITNVPLCVLEPAPTAARSCGPLSRP